MIFLMACSILGLIMSAFIHLFAILCFYHPQKVLITILNFGILFLLCSRGIVTKKIREKIGKDTVGKTLFISCPRFLKIVAGVVIVYGVANSIFSSIAFYSEAMTTDNMEFTLSKFFRGLSALWIAIYIFEFSLLYCYRKLWKAQLRDDTLNLRMEHSNIN